MVFFAGCSHVAPELTNDPAKLAFPNEDEMILAALDSQERGDYVLSYSLYDELYNKSGKKQYLLEALTALVKTGDMELALQKLNASKEELAGEEKLYHLLLAANLHAQNFDEALEAALEALKVNKSERNYELCASVYFTKKDYQNALKYLQGGYALNKNEALLDKVVSTLYYFLDEKDEAISLLESHSRLFGCSRLVCERLAGIYKDQKDIQKLATVYHRLYDVYGASEYANAVVEIYIYKKDFRSAIEFLEKSKSDDKLLIDLYVVSKKYDKAKNLINEIYAQNGDINLLARSAMYEYEFAEDKNDTKMLDSVVKKLSEVVTLSDNDNYLNFLGYLLIDHNLDIKKGIEYVNEALKKKPESPYYLDSLAWGYYKQKKCKEAKALMEKVRDLMEGKKEEEIDLHYKIINECKD